MKFILNIFGRSELVRNIFNRTWNNPHLIVIECGDVGYPNELLMFKKKVSLK